MNIRQGARAAWEVTSSMTTGKLPLFALAQEVQFFAAWAAFEVFTKPHAATSAGAKEDSLRL